MASVITISLRESDANFGYSVAKLAGMNSILVTKNSNLLEAIQLSRNVIILWDCDNPLTRQDSNHALAVANTYRILRANVGDRRVMLITSNHLTKNQALLRLPMFSHHIRRNFNRTGAILVAQMARSLCNPTAFGLREYLGAKAKLQPITLKKSKEKDQAIGALANVLKALKVHGRVSRFAVSAVDELIVNALFRAPIRNGYRYRAHTSLNEEFSLSEEERIDIELSFSEFYVGVCVRDYFGSLKKESLLFHLARNYEKTSYLFHSKKAPIGLGIYEIAETGLTFLFSTVPEVKTEAFLFVPRVKSFVSFRKSTQIFGCF